MITAKNDNKAAFDLKGSAFTILVLSLRNADLDAVSAQLGEKTRSAPEFFHNAPIVLDLHLLSEDQPLDLAMLVNLIRGQGLLPVGITGCTEEQKGRAEILELAFLSSRAGGKKEQDVVEEDPVEEDVLLEEEELSLSLPAPGEEQARFEQPATSALIVTDPVRSGQSILAAQSDLVVMAAVGSGAEITASGNIHVYGALRGRAFAGNEGDTAARIFCQRLEAELVSIAGVHLVNEDFPASLRARPVQIQLQANRLHITAL